MYILQSVSEVNRERSRLAAESSVCDSTKHNGLVTKSIIFYMLQKRDQSPLGQGFQSKTIFFNKIENGFFCKGCRRWTV